MRRLIIIMIVLTASMLACRINSRETVNDLGTDPTELDLSSTYRLVLEERPANLGLLKMNLNRLGAFHGRFVLTFEGQTNWTYTVDTRSDGEKIEYQLAIQGLDSVLDLGDVRLVNSMNHNYMSGEGTDDFCIQFPDSFETEPPFLGPTDFIRLSEFSEPPEIVSNDQVLGREAVRYTTPAVSYRGWRDVSASFWLDQQTNAVLWYEFFSEGEDPLYHQGEGKLHGVFEVLEIGPQQIAEIPGCSIDFPIPKDASEVIRFPGLISFVTERNLKRVDKYYTNRFEPAGWIKGESQISADEKSAILEFASGDESAIIRIERVEQGDYTGWFLVEVFLDE